MGKRIRWSSLLSLMVWGTLSVAQGAPPTALRTDLLEHTDRVWMDGYLTQLTLDSTARAIERLQIPLIHNRQPMFGWQVNDVRSDVRQTAYQIMVATTPELLWRFRPDMWNSGTINSDNSVAVRYEGKPLQPNTDYYWMVRSANNGFMQEWSQIRAFRTASELADYQTAVYPLEKTDEDPVTLRRCPDGTYWVDFGRASFAQLKLTLEADGEGDSVTVHLGEALKEGRVDRRPPGTIRYQSMKLGLLPGRHTYFIKIPAGGRNTRTTPPLAVLMPDYIGEVYPFRYCEVEGYDRPLSASALSRQSVNYPFDDTAVRFTSSDTVLNRVWELCRYSVKATSFAGIYVDGDRERIPYEADALLNQLCHYYADNEYSLARRSHEYLLYNATWPTEWILQSVLIAWYDYLYTGDVRSARAHYELLKKKTLSVLEDENGIISVEGNPRVDSALKESIHLPQNQRLADITDWPRDRFVFTPRNISPNSFHYASLAMLSRLAGAMGETADSVAYAQQAAKVRNSINRLFFDRKSGLYRDGIGTDSVSLYSNIFPVALGVAEPRMLGPLGDYIASRGMECSVYASQFLMEALYETGQAEQALDLMSSTDLRSWYNMIRAGSTVTTEAWDILFKPNQDWNHIWGAVPGNIIPRKLMGVEPIEPGFRRVRIAPQPAWLSEASITVPTIRGEVSVSFENRPGSFDLTVEMPANMTGDVYLPLGSGVDAKRVQVEMDGEVLSGLEPENGSVKIAGVGSGPHTFRLTSH